MSTPASVIAPLGAGLTRRDQAMQPADVAIQAKKRLTQYVISPAVDIDHTEQTHRKLSRKVFHRARICALETFWYPTKNRSQAKLENPDREPELIAWEKTAFDQATEMLTGYGIYGLKRLDSITGMEMEVVSALEQLLMPSPRPKADDESDSEYIEFLGREMERIYALPNLKLYLETVAVDNIKGLEGDASFAVAERLRRELLQAVDEAAHHSRQWLTLSETEINKAMTGQKCKSQLDPLDFKLYAALGITPAADLLARTVGTQVPGSEYRSAFEQTDKRTLSKLEQRIAELEAAATAPSVPAPVVEVKPARATKLCVDCAEEIYTEARICRYCRAEQAKDEGKGVKNGKEK